MKSLFFLILILINFKVFAITYDGKDYFSSETAYSPGKDEIVRKKYKSKKEVLYQINEEACKFFEKNLYSPDGEKALEYLKKREISDENLKDYRIGWASEDETSLVKYLKNLGFSEDEIVASGLAISLKRGTVDIIHGRITFPLWDDDGRIIGYSARQLKDGKPKYINLRKTKIHDATKIFFNQYQAKNGIEKSKSAIVFEGNFDSLMAYFHGINNTVSLMGIKMTDSQIKKIFNEADTVYLCLDSDFAGKDATREIAEMMLPYLKRGKTLKIAKLPYGLDADEVILKRGKDELLKIIDNSIDISEYFWNYEYKEAVKKYEEISLREKIKIYFKMFYIAQKIADPELRLQFMEYYEAKLKEI